MVPHHAWPKEDVRLYDPVNLDQVENQHSVSSILRIEASEISKTQQVEKFTNSVRSCHKIMPEGDCKIPIEHARQAASEPVAPSQNLCHLCLQQVGHHSSPHHRSQRAIPSPPARLPASLHSA